jgi:hypothetical protein
MIRAFAAGCVLALAACGSANPLSGAPPVATAPVSDASSEPDVAEAAAPATPVDQIPWTTGASTGFGVASKDTGNPLGDSMFIAYAGYGVDLVSAEAWATALYTASLRARGVRFLWAVQGPADPSYTQDEIGNSDIAHALVPLVSAQTSFVLVVAHSSGGFVADELLDQLASGMDPGGVTANKIVLFDLDGGNELSQAAIDRMRNAYYVGSRDGTTLSPNYDVMTTEGAKLAAKGGFFENDASLSGCEAGAEWCVHITLVNTLPHDKTTMQVDLDYSDYVGRPVCTSYIDAKASEAGL